MKYTVQTTLLLSCCALAGACSDDSDGKSQQPATGTYDTYDPCVLVTQAESEAALGITLKNTKHNTEPINATGQKICYYEDASGKDMKFVQISINEQASMSSGLTVQQLYQSTKDQLEGETPVAGLGDDAFYGGHGLKLGAGVTTLVKASGIMINMMVGLGTGNSDDAAHQEMEKNLTLKALGRL